MAAWPVQRQARRPGGRGANQPGHGWSCLAVGKSVKIYNVAVHDGVGQFASWIFPVIWHLAAVSGAAGTIPGSLMQQDVFVIGHPLIMTVNVRTVVIGA
jgi:hypothetical protein